MPYASPIYSVKTKDVYHNNTPCKTRNNIETENVRQGTGGLPLCKECAKLNQEGK